MTEKDIKKKNIEGTYKQNREPKLEDTATDIYYKTDCKLPDSKVAIPTEDSVQEAKEWVDNENLK
ncbi:MAG: DUF3787 domain-containing protein [Tissierellia bacterium]|nr:DUF3787 domain-containing protein [Tissierellia bacterium]MDD4725969.1 DUF3787 domain-containing protein [Tissierellia bacterium]